jgi:hypothetical protein
MNANTSEKIPLLSLRCAIAHPLSSVVVTRVEIPYVALIPVYNRVVQKLCDYVSRSQI